MMPKVPQQKGPTQTLQVVAQPRAQAVNLGPSPFAAPLAEAAQVVDDIYRRKVKADSSDALLKYERDVQTLLYAQGEGYIYLRGKDAVDRSRDVLKKLDDLKKQYADSLEIPEAQQAFLQTAEAHALRYRQQILTHADKESRFYQGEVLKDEVGNTVTNASLFYGDPKNMFIEKQRGLAAVNEALQLQGLDSDPDIALARRRAFLDSFHTSAVESALGVKDISGAERLLKDADKELTPKAKAALKERVQQLRKSLEHENLLANAQVAADALFDPANKSVWDMEAEARKKYSGEMEKFVVSEIRSRYGTWDLDRKEENLNIYNDAFDSARSGVSPDKLPPEVRVHLTPAQKLELDRVYQKYHGTDSTGGKKSSVDEYLSMAQDAVDSVWDPANKSLEDMEATIHGSLSGRAERAAIADLRGRWRDFDRARKAGASTDHLVVAQAAVDGVWDPVGKTYEEMAAEIRRNKKLDGKPERAAIIDLKSRWGEFEKARKAAEKEGRGQEFLSMYKKVLDGENPDSFSDSKLGPHEREFLASAFRVRHKKPPVQRRGGFTDTEAGNIRALQTLYRMKPEEVEKIGDIVEFFQSFGGGYKGANKAMSYYKEVLRSARAGHKEPPKLYKAVDVAEKNPAIENAFRTVMAPLNVERTRLMKKDSPSSSDLEELDKKTANRRMTLRAMLAVAIENTPEDQRDEQRYEQIANNLVREFRESEDLELLDDIPPSVIPSLMKEIRDAFPDGGMPPGNTIYFLHNYMMVKKLMKDEGLSKEEAIAQVMSGG